ncbi:MAG: cysteine desulfurase [Bacteroidetes bacterium]|nr:cysteine desulfurase [Bacteroidota bacterium]MCW5897277.1 cysteine desulfurase [Bacteroidota bacterium]
MEIASATYIEEKLKAPVPVESCRFHFPLLRRQVNGKPLVYFDNAATSQKPQVVIDAIMRYYHEENSNIHRGVHYLSTKATEAYEEARLKVQRFINARSIEEVIYVRGTTEAINLVATTYGRKNVSEGDEVLISAMEHHSNIVPWQMLCEERKATMHIIPMNDAGELLLDEYEQLLGERTKIVCLAHISNALGTINPIKRMIAAAHAKGIPVLIDGAQAMPHMRVDMQDLDCDFYAFSSHKMFGPTGVGVLYGKKELLNAMPPYQGGGDMIKSVTFEKTTYNDLPYKFEAGTPNIEGAIGLGAAIDYMKGMDLTAVAAYEHELLTYAAAKLLEIPGLRIIGTAKEKASVISFVLEGIHPHDIGTILDYEGIAIRTGHHCAQPVMQRFGVPATARASFAFYNTKEEVDVLVKAIYKVKEVLG